MMPPPYVDPGSSACSKSRYLMASGWPEAPQQARWLPRPQGRDLLWDVCYGVASVPGSGSYGLAFRVPIYSVRRGNPVTRPEFRRPT